ncbi:hypothetical protein [Lutibacter sp.]
MKKVVEILTKNGFESVPPLNYEYLLPSLKNLFTNSNVIKFELARQNK